MTGRIVRHAEMDRTEFDDADPGEAGKLVERRNARMIAPGIGGDQQGPLGSE